MRLSDIVLGNLARRKGRAIFLLAGLTIGVGTVVALRALTTSIQQEIGAQLDQYGANIVVVPGSRTQEISYGGVAVSAASFDVRPLTDEDVRAIRRIPYGNRLAVVAPKLLGMADAGGHEAVLAGVDFGQEIKSKRWWQIAGRAPEAENEVLIGYEAAKSLGVIEAASTPAAAQHGSHANHPPAKSTELKVLQPHISVGGEHFLVTGVLHETGAQDDGFIYANLATARRLLNQPGQVSLVEVSALCQGCPIEDIVGQIRAALPGARVSAVQQVVRARVQTVERLSRFSAVISGVMVVVAFLLVLSAMTASVIERTREIGVMRALGYRKRHVAQIILGEAAIISVLGGLLGWALGTSAGMLSVQRLSETGVTVRPSASLALAAVTATVLVAVTSSIYPAIKAARLDPAESLRYY